MRGPVAHLVGPPAIHDCRAVFPPLTRIQSCCTYTVGDGMMSFGDFDTIQAAVDALPLTGGEICVLPGTYPEHVTIDKDNVRIHGCGMRSRVIADTTDPVFHVAGHSGIRIEGLFIRADENGIGILVETKPQGVVPARILLDGPRHGGGARSRHQGAGRELGPGAPLHHHHVRPARTLACALLALPGCGGRAQHRHRDADRECRWHRAR